jgi:hypothetical protein
MQNLVVPETLRPLFWSYDFSKIDPLRHKKTIIVQVLNYGNLDQWRWLLRTYGRDGLQDAVAGRWHAGYGVQDRRSPARAAFARHRSFQLCTARHSPNERRNCSAR